MIFDWTPGNPIRRSSSRFGAHSARSGTMKSISFPHWEMVVSQREGETTFTMRGPHTTSEPLFCLADGNWVGIQFKIGTFMLRFSPSSLLNKDSDLPNAGDRSFWLDGSAWQFPDFENADSFVARLIRAGLLARDPVVDGAMQIEDA